MQDRTGNLWFATNGGGLSRFDGKSFTTYTVEQGLPTNHLTIIHEDQEGHLWCPTLGGGVSRFDGRFFTTYTEDDGLGSNTVSDMLEDRLGTLWFCTDNGLSRYDGKSFLNYTTRDGLADSVVYQITLTKEGNLAIGTNAGVSVLTGYVPQLEEDESALPAQNKLTNEALKHYRPVFEIYNTKTGFPIKDANVGQNSMFLDSKGIIWMGTGSAASGMVRLDFSALHRNPNPLDVFIQSVRVNNTAIAWVDLMAAKNNTPSLGTTTTPANVTDETLMFGKPLSPEERKAMRDKFGSIKFSDVEKFYYVPENPVVPHDLNTLTLDFAAIEPARPRQCPLSIYVGRI